MNVYLKVIWVKTSSTYSNSYKKLSTLIILNKGNSIIKIQTKRLLIKNNISYVILCHLQILIIYLWKKIILLKSH